MKLKFHKSYKYPIFKAVISTAASPGIVYPLNTSQLNTESQHYRVAANLSTLIFAQPGRKPIKFFIVRKQTASVTSSAHFPHSSHSLQGNTNSPKSSNK